MREMRGRRLLCGALTPPPLHNNTPLNTTHFTPPLFCHTNTNTQPIAVQTFKALTPGTKYQIRVTPVNAKGSGPSAVAGPFTAMQIATTQG